MPFASDPKAVSECLNGTMIEERDGTDKETPFIDAARYDNYTCLVLLGIEFKAKNPNALTRLDKDDWSALTWASHRGHLASLEFIVQNELAGDFNLKNLENKTALYYAQSEPDEDHASVATYLKGRSFN